MRRLTSSLRTLMLGFLIASAYGVSHATLIAIFSRPGEPLRLEEAASLARALKGNPATSLGKQFAAKLCDSSALTAEYSVPPGVSAYFWSDRTFEHRGFQMKGVQATFEIGPAAIQDTAQVNVFGDSMIGNEADSATTGIAVTREWTTEFQGASLNSKRVEIRYTLREPGVVSMELFDLNGRHFGRWSWVENSSGWFQHIVNLNQAPHGPLLMRWNMGNVQVIRQLRILGN